MKGGFRGRITTNPDPAGRSQANNGVPALKGEAKNSGKIGKVTTMAKGYNGGRSGGTSAGMGPKPAPPMAKRVKNPGRNTNTSARTPKAPNMAQAAAANRNADGADGIRGLANNKVGPVTTRLDFGMKGKKYGTHPGIPMAKGTHAC